MTLIYDLKVARRKNVYEEHVNWVCHLVGNEYERERKNEKMKKIPSDHSIGWANVWWGSVVKKQCLKVDHYRKIFLAGLLEWLKTC